MKTMLRATAAAGLLALSASAMAPIIHAQDAQPAPPMGRRGPGPGGPGFGGPMDAPGPIGLPLRELDLSEAQRTQVRSIMESHAAAQREIGDRLRAAHQALEAAVTAETMDEAAIRARSADLAAVQADAAVLRARIHQEIFSILTAEQQARARELRAQAEARLQERAGQLRQRRPPR